MSDQNKAVVAHLVRLIQDNVDVRYYVGGPHTRMRELLVEAIKAQGFEGDPLDALKPPPHRVNDEPRVQLLARECDRYENGLVAVREALPYGRDNEVVIRMIERLQAGGEADE